MSLWASPREGMGSGCNPVGGISRVGSIPTLPTPEFECWATQNGYRLNRHPLDAKYMAGMYVSHFTRHALIGWTAAIAAQRAAPAKETL